LKFNVKDIIYYEHFGYGEVVRVNYGSLDVFFDKVKHIHIIMLPNANLRLLNPLEKALREA
jgi:hypothetical protein